MLLNDGRRVGKRVRKLDVVRRYVAWERKWGGPINGFLATAYEWLFVALGPFAIILGALFVVWGFWLGLVLVLAGAWMTWAGWARLIRFARREH